MSEKLSHHVIQNYDKFVEGVNEVIHVEEDLQVRRSFLNWVPGGHCRVVVLASLSCWHF